MDAIEFNAARQISVPVKVELLQDHLHWEAEVSEEGFADPSREWLGDKVVVGCLEAFTQLSDAAPEVILAFARQYGVLGVMPCGETVAAYHEIGGKPRIWRFRYVEPVAVYQALARQARSILLVMAALRSGKPINLDEYLNCFAAENRPYDGEQAAAESRRIIYMCLVMAVGDWADRADYKFRLGFGAGFSTGQTPTMIPHYFLDFGHWNQGASWDIHQMPMYVNEEEYSDKVFGEAVCELAGRTSAEELGAGPDHDIYCLPSPYQRPSPLFNVLAFQLTQALTVAEGTYLCSGCKKFTSPEGPRNRPRRDMKNWTCSEACEKTHKAEEDKKRWQAKKQAALADH